jgi:hypothetical protein
VKDYLNSNAKETGMIYKVLGELYKEMGDFSNAIVFLHKALLYYSKDQSLDQQVSSDLDMETYQVVKR